MVFLPAFLQISSVTYAEPGRGAKSRWESAGKQRQKGLAPAKAYKDIKLIHCWNNVWLCEWQLNQSNRCLQRKATEVGKRSHLSYLVLSVVVDANKSAYLGHTTDIDVVYQSLGLIWDLTALERNVFGLEGVADQQAVSTFCLFPQISLPPRIWIHFCVAPGLCLSNTATWLISSFPISYILRFLSFFLHLHPLSSAEPACTPPCCRFHPHYSLPQPEPRQAGFPAGGPDGALASQPALGLWACRTAGRPFCGRYGPGQSWHLSVTMDQQGDGKAGTQSEPCQYTADWEANCGGTQLTHRHVT